VPRWSGEGSRGRAFRGGPWGPPDVARRLKSKTPRRRLWQPTKQRRQPWIPCRWTTFRLGAREPPHLPPCTMTPLHNDSQQHQREPKNRDFRVSRGGKRSPDSELVRRELSRSGGGVRKLPSSRLLCVSFRLWQPMKQRRQPWIPCRWTTLRLGAREPLHLPPGAMTSLPTFGSTTRALYDAFTRPSIGPHTKGGANKNDKHVKGRGNRARIRNLCAASSRNQVSVRKLVHNQINVM
jgi:hypothetical protein